MTKNYNSNKEETKDEAPTRFHCNYKLRKWQQSSFLRKATNMGQLVWIERICNEINWYRSIQTDL